MTGLKDIDGATYYFNANGYRFTGAIKLDNYTYYFHPESGKLCKGYAGLYRIGDNSNDYYFFLNSREGSGRSQHVGKVQRQILLRRR